MTTRDPRPSLTPALERVVADVVDRSAELNGLDPRAILVVALGAHGDAVASVRSLHDVSKRVVVGGHARTVELGLRPRFFLDDADAPRRLATLVHELLHLDTSPAGVKRGALLEGRRHKNRSHAVHEKDARRIANNYLELTKEDALLCLAHDGEVMLRHWLRRPVETTSRAAFDDDDVFEGPLRIVTPPKLRGGWW